MILLTGIIASYLMGSLPFGLIAAKARGVDLRKVGSGNIGATNVLRGVGKKEAAFTLLGDTLKGAAAVALGRILGMDALGQGLMGLAAVLGHDFSILLGFKGGKGVATSLGVVMVYSPLAGFFTLVTWVFTAYLKKYSSLAAIVSFICLPVWTALFDPERVKIPVAALMALLILLKHAENIKKLANKTERKIGERA